MKKAKVAIVGTVGIPACYGGFESLVENLTLNASDDVDYTVFCSSKSYDEKLTKYNDATLLYLPIKANGIQSIPYDILSLVRCIHLRPDVVVILGVSGCLFLPLFRFLSRSRVVTNIDGLEWKRDKWGKLTRSFLKWSESLAVKYSDIVVTDNQAITDYVKEQYNISSSTIAYGGDHALRDIEAKKTSKPYALGLCRIEPENNVLMILDAYSKVGEQLRFVGNWEASEYGRQLKARYSQFDNIELLDPIYNLDELYRIRMNCNLYLHGHSAGGTNPSLVEMMHFGVPIIAFDCSFNRYSTNNKASYFKDAESLVDMLNNRVSYELKKNANAMKEIAVKSYTWCEITSCYEATYTMSTHTK
ncbi:DUF1972 domain-containing protein [Vibrio splendidus]|uniref:DUF1972 domain-containing protein n=1 Tax=Vibrio splendidus TaxID=29497 RepID=UPI000D3A27B2|nr:DUF1972 domain-containing protein [Vibrio splendidus]PTP72411.1 glycosyl transferase [Vibrio splendidus]